MAEELWLVDEKSKSYLLKRLKTLHREYSGKKKRSKKLFAQAKRHMPGGVASNLRYFPPFPLFFKGARGSRVRDADGMQYVDYNLSYGAMILGHNHPYVARKAASTIAKYGSTNFGAPIELASEMAGRLASIFPCAEMSRFCQSGTEAVMHSIRIARGYTGKPLIAKFEGHYHGTYDDVLVSTTPAPGEGGPVAEPEPVSSSKGIPEEVYKNTVVLPFNDLDAAEKIIRKNRDRLACVIMELVSKGYVPADREFARGIRELTEDLGILLIVDEVLTGFRVHYRGAQHVYGIRPDITCLGKIVGGGVPLSVVAGRKEIMKVVAPASRDSEKFVYHSGTYNGSTIGLSYGLATLDVLGRQGIYPRLISNTDKLKKGLGGVFSDAGIPARLQGMGGMFNLLFCAGEVKRHRDTFKEDMLKRAVFDCTLLLNGVYVVPARRFNVSVVHSGDDLKRTMSAAMKAAEAIVR